MVYLIDQEEEEFSDKHRISLFDDSKFEDATIEIKGVNDHDEYDDHESDDDSSDHYHDLEHTK
jgi:hypothetical protein